MFTFPRKFQLLFLLVALVSMISATAAAAAGARDAASPWTPNAYADNAAAAAHADPFHFKRASSNKVNRRAQMSNAERLRLGMPLKKPVIWGADGRQVKLSDGGK
ncbi:hypothetical protein I317_03266 [Kwoniella heveanensis CBS 569]|uniref:Uncharacterized protein n=1 Tax=Kwoniella heveanensis BCC8398 TaxID=1296120 RepID=A0A1B9H0R8_9TREE|nr:hypothetical protein I316_01468 [Kwoniella heveanensis BCC8398]OCF42915.1 hypothetical protein I317_03266 [Kwoniella heveanensis CBS 569]